jgi:protein TonB
MSILIAALTSTLLAEPELSPPPPTIQIPANWKKLKGATAVFAPKPDYPKYARARHWVGAGWYVMNVDTDTGLVTSVEIIQSSGHKILDQAAVDAFRRWRFQPGRVGRAKCPVTWTMRVQPKDQFWDQ